MGKENFVSEFPSQRCGFKRRFGLIFRLIQCHLLMTEDLGFHTKKKSFFITFYIFDLHKQIVNKFKKNIFTNILSVEKLVFGITVDG